jgi:hypothetical protein
MDALLSLHPTCAAQPGVHLLGDVPEAVLAQGDGVWAGRAARAAGAALRAKETRS